MFLNREHGGCSNGLMPRSNLRCNRSAVPVVRQMAGCVVHSLVQDASLAVVIDQPDDLMAAHSKSVSSYRMIQGSGLLSKPMP